MQIKFSIKPFWALVIFLAIVAIGVFFVFRESFKKEKPDEIISGTVPQPSAPKSPELYFVSENELVLYYTRGQEIEAALAPDRPLPINSILPSPDRRQVAFFLQGGQVKENDLGPFFEGMLRLKISKQKVYPSQDQFYTIVADAKVSSLAYFWYGQNIFVRAALLDQQGNRQMQHWQASATRNNLKSISAKEYDDIVRSQKLEIIFSDFVSGAFRKSNQTYKGDKLTLDRDQINVNKNGQIVPLIKASQFFTPSDSLFSTFQISPDEKHIAFTKDSDQCDWISARLDIKLMNQLFIYNLETGKQVMVAAHNSPMNFLWIDNETLAYDLGFGDKTKLYLYSLKDGKTQEIADQIDYYKGPRALFFLNNSPRCET